jgi:hypothetical protein
LVEEGEQRRYEEGRSEEEQRQIGHERGERGLGDGERIGGGEKEDGGP